MDTPVFVDQQKFIYINSGCSLEDLPEAMDDRADGERDSGNLVPLAQLDDEK